MKRLIIVEHEPLTKIAVKNFYIEELQRDGLDIEYWDVSKIVHGEMRIAEELNEPYLKKIMTIDKFRELVSVYSGESVFLVEVFETWNARNIFKILNDFEVTSLRIDTYATAVVPLELKQKLLYLRSISYLKKVVKNRLLNRKLEQFYNSNKIFKYNILFTSANIPPSNNMEVVRINSVDYEKYIEDRDADNLLPGEKYCVFLDEYMPFHPDTLYIFKVKSVDPEKYFTLMNRLFDHIEQTMKIKVVIAGHPKSNYNSDVFKGRRILKYKTSQLVKFSEFVIVHTSLSLHHAILNYKPIVFTAFKELKKRSIRGFAIISYRAAFLNRPINMLDNFNSLSILPVDKDRYDAYKYQFLTSVETEDVRNKDIVMRRIKEIASA